MLGLSAGAAAVAYRDTSYTRVRHVRLTSVKLTPGTSLRVLQVSDTHDLAPGRVDALLRLARSQHPDLIATTGDIVNTDTSDFSSVERLLRGLVAITPTTFYVRGNHDHWNARHTELWDLVATTGVIPLVNEQTTLTGAFGTITLVGTDDYYTHHGSMPSQRRDPGRYTLVLTHAPEFRVELKKARSGIDLALCGHTHGGQIRLPLVGALIIPGQGRFPTYSKGLYPFAGGTLYIDSGVGTTGPRLRFWNQSQISLIEVRAG